MGHVYPHVDHFFRGQKPVHSYQIKWSCDSLFWRYCVYSKHVIVQWVSLSALLWCLSIFISFALTCNVWASFFAKESFSKFEPIFVHWELSWVFTNLWTFFVCPLKKVQEWRFRIKDIFVMLFLSDSYT